MTHSDPPGRSSGPGRPPGRSRRGSRPLSRPGSPLLPGGPVGVLAGALAVATVGLQIAYPPASDATRTRLSIVTVLVFAAASVTDAVRTGGLRAAAALLACGGVLGGVAEVVGVHTGRPFGAYAYTGTLGPQLFGVPLVVPLAWTMAAWPAWRVAGLLATGRAGRWSGSGWAGGSRREDGSGRVDGSRRAPGRRARIVRWVAGSWALASWDLFLDPQMVAGHHWVWAHPTPALPGVPGVPGSNFLGWVGVAAVVVGALELLLGPHFPPGRSPGPVVGLLAGWTWVGGIVANGVFFHRPGVALVGGVAMGLVAVPAILGHRSSVGAPAGPGAGPGHPTDRCGDRGDRADDRAQVSAHGRTDRVLR